MKREHPEHGSIKVYATERGKPYPQIDGWTVIPAWSRGSVPYNQLSPFFLRIVDEETQIETNFESWWQSWKVYERVYARNDWDWKWPEEVHGEPNETWKNWHIALLKNPKPVRRPNGREIPLFAWWKGERLGVVEARKQIYIPYIQRLYRAHPVYQKLLELVRDGTNVIIVEPDGASGGLDASIDRLIELQDKVTQGEALGGTSKRYFPYGHGYCIALTLLEDLK